MGQLPEEYLDVAGCVFNQAKYPTNWGPNAYKRRMFLDGNPNNHVCVGFLYNILSLCCLQLFLSFFRKRLKDSPNMGGRFSETATPQLFQLD